MHASNRAPLLLATLCYIAAWPTALAAPPRALLEGYDLQLIAREPEIVTPVALTLMQDGSLLVIESHTHKRPDEYGGPTSDRIRRYADTDGDGDYDTWSTFADGFRHAMNIVMRDDGAVIVVTRMDVFLLIDTDGDGASDHQTTLVHLDTEIDYPHNALSGFVFDGRGGFYLGLGENFGGEYRLVGSDGAEFADSGGTGMIFHFAGDGSQLTKYAQGFWNPFGLARIGDDTMFAVDNDPDASPPCRLIHVVDTGDYGHRWEFGRAGIHPLQSWDGELPGMLPMVCGTGEAPCAVVPHDGHLWVTSWGDHRLERYKLQPRGMSFAATREVVVQGDADFRPTGCVVAPDGTLYFADWVSRSYPVHGMGRIWRLKANTPAPNTEWPAVAEVESVRHAQRNGPSAAQSDDPFACQLAVASLDETRARAALANDDSRLVALQALRWLGTTDVDQALQLALGDADPIIRLFALRWAADLHRTEMRDEVAKLLEGEIPSDRYYLAVLATLHWLEGDRSPPPKNVADGLLARELRNSRRSPERKALALRLISPTHKQLTLDVLNAYIEGNHEQLRTEAVRTLTLSAHPERFIYLAKVAGDETMGEAVRADAVAGLAGQADKFGHLFERLAGSDLPLVAKEAQRVQRLAGIVPLEEEPHPEATEVDAWLAMVDGRGDAESGRRLFYSSAGPRCGTCHSLGGRGGDYGPDLTRYGRTHDRRQALTAILEPSRDIAPRYVPWVLETDDGKTHVGLRLARGGDSGTEPYITSEGKRFDLKSETVEFREPSKNSIMPDGLEKTVSVEDLADLVAFLMGE